MAPALHNAASAAEIRHFGGEAIRLHRACADAALRAGNRPRAAYDLAQIAEHVRDLPFYREEGHLATARLLVVTALAGDRDETAAFGERFREGWERAGRNRWPPSSATCQLVSSDHPAGNQVHR